jgi:putative effector of murein hydrolase LrgA (UPF0299 family)
MRAMRLLFLLLNFRENNQSQVEGIARQLPHTMEDDSAK